MPAASAPTLRILVFACALTALVLISGRPASPVAGGADLQADANCSGEVDTVDALAILRHAADLSPAACQQLADVQCDGDIDTIDALQVLRWGAALSVSQQPGCTPIGEATGPPPTSFDLIEDAVADGDLDDETGLVYQFYAGFNDPRLPEKYIGDDSNLEDLPFLSKVAEMWPDLAQDTRDLILPFMRTPAEPDSWYNQNAARVGAAGIEWGTVASASHPVKIWWETRFPKDQARANAFIDALGTVDTGIWKKLTDLMGVVPLPDCGAACPSGGGDPRLDIYLVGPSVDANYTWWNPPDTPTCETTPAYITLLPDVTRATLAHEFMHVLQFALNYANDNGCKDRWWSEATGMWAKDYVYGRNFNWERHYWAEVFLQFPELSLEDRFLYRYYGAYLFPSYLHRVRGKPELVPRIFARMGSEPDVFKAIESEVSAELGDFGELWKDFTLKNWNQDPVTNYLDIDGLEFGANFDEPERTIGVGEIEIDDAGVEHLAAVYENFTFSSDVHTVVFTNTLAGVEHAGVMAILKVDGAWKDPEDWSEKSEKEFCLDRPGEELDQLIIIFSNSDALGRTKLTPSSPPTIEGKQDGCSGWEGSVSVEGIGGYGGRAIYTAATQAIRFDQSEDFPTVFNLVAGKVHWTVSGFGYKDCVVSGQLDYDISTGRGMFGGNLVIDTFDDSLYSVFIYGGDADAKEVWVCPPPDEAGWSGEWNWFEDIGLIGDGSESRDLPLTGDPGSRIAAGEYKDSSGFTHRWSFIEYGTIEE